MRYSYSEPDVVKIMIGEWLVTIRGHNLEPLIEAIEKRSLAKLRVQPELMNDRKYEIDSFATGIRLQPNARGADGQPAQSELPFFR